MPGASGRSCSPIARARCAPASRRRRWPAPTPPCCGRWRRRGSLAVPGARGWDLQEAVCLTFEEAGYATPLRQPGTTTGYVHNLGHGIGYELHELPIFRKVAGAEGVLAEGDVFTLEPGLYDPAAGYGVRLEDLCYLGADGLEVLTPLPYDLDPRRWTLNP